MEIWKEIGIKDFYISNYGNFKKENYGSRKKPTNKTILIKPTIKENGYLQTRAYNKEQKKTKNLYVHRLVAQAFIPNLKNLPCVNHKDGNKFNNHVDNLEWCSYKQNMEHAKKTGLLKRYYGKDNKQSRVYVELDENYNFIREIIGSRQFERENGFSREKVARIARHELYMTREKQIYLFANEYYSKNIKEIKKEHEEKVKLFLKEKYKKYKKK